MKTASVIFSFVTGLLLSGGCAAPNSGCGAAAAPPIWIDVRTADEYRTGHAENAIHIPYDVIADQIGEAAPDKAHPITLYCRSGRRSAIALATLQELGYQQLTDVGGLSEAAALKSFVSD